MPLPTLVVVGGPPGSGKTTLAHRLAKALGCPAICRDEIKEGMVHTNPGFVPAPGDPLTMRTLSTFFEVLEVLLRAGVTVVAEAAFQRPLWTSKLEPLRDRAYLTVVTCTVAPAVARERIAHRLDSHARAAHADRDLLRAQESAFDPLVLPVPTITVDTTDDYHPALEDVIAFLKPAAPAP